MFYYVSMEQLYSLDKRSSDCVVNTIKGYFEGSVGRLSQNNP